MNHSSDVIKWRNSIFYNYSYHKFWGILIVNYLNVESVVCIAWNKRWVEYLLGVNIKQKSKFIIVINKVKIYNIGCLCFVALFMYTCMVVYISHSRVHLPYFNISWHCVMQTTEKGVCLEEKQPNNSCKWLEKWWGDIDIS